MMPTVDLAYLSRLEEAIKGQREAQAYYSRLAELAPNEEARKIILGIKADEQKHEGLLSQTYFYLSGKQPHMPAVAAPNVPSYYPGVRQAIFDELDAAETYRDLLLDSPSMHVRDTLFYIMMDEIEHAIKLSLLYSDRFGVQDKYQEKPHPREAR